MRCALRLPTRFHLQLNPQLLPLLLQLHPKISQQKNTPTLDHVSIRAYPEFGCADFSLYLVPWLHNRVGSNFGLR